MAKDPICQMDVDEATVLRAERDGQTYYFCSEHCRRKFLGEDEQRPPHHEHHEHGHHAATATYFCAMCEGVESSRAGDCPKFGVSLESPRPAIPKTRTV